MASEAVALSGKTSKSLYRRLKDVWQFLPPAWNNRVRHAPILGDVLWMVAQATVKSATHQEIYDERYNRFLDVAASDSTRPMAATLERLFKPNSVIDVGCGTGALLAQLKQIGLEVKGLEYSDAGIALCREKGVEVVKFDLETEEAIQEDWDLTVSFEVAEHLPASLADNYVKVISQFSPVVIMSAATGGQGGKDHINEQSHEYWIEKMHRRDFDYDGQTSHLIRVEWAASGVAPWYVNNTMIFRRKMAQDHLAGT